MSNRMSYGQLKFEYDNQEPEAHPDDFPPEPEPDYFELMQDEEI